MEESRRLKIITSVLFVIVLGITAGILTIFSNKEKETYQTNNVLGITSVESAPYITSVSPVNAYVGEKYIYNVRFSDKDTSSENIYMVLVGGSPDWLSLTGSTVSGTPPVGSEGSYKFSIRISDGANSSVQDNYILVQDNEKQ
jgi:hypothetical protein